MPSSIRDIGAFFQQKVLYSLSAVENEFPYARCREDALLQQAQFDVKYGLQLFWPQCLEDHNFVYTVHEFRGELAPRRFRRGAINLFFEAGIQDIRFPGEAETALDQVRHLAGAQV